MQQFIETIKMLPALSALRELPQRRLASLTIGVPPDDARSVGKRDRDEEPPDYYRSVRQRIEERVLDPLPVELKEHVLKWLKSGSMFTSELYRILVNFCATSKATCSPETWELIAKEMLNLQQGIVRKSWKELVYSEGKRHFQLMKELRTLSLPVLKNNMRFYSAALKNTLAFLECMHILASRFKDSISRFINEDDLSPWTRTLGFVPTDRADYSVLAMEAVGMDGFVLENVPRDRADYTAIALKAVDKNWEAMQFVQIDYKDYTTIALKAIAENWKAVDLVVNDREVVLKGIYTNKFTLEHVPPDYKYYTDIALRAIETDAYSLQYVPLDYEDYLEIALKAVENDGYALKYVPRGHENYTEIALMAIMTDKYALKLVPDDHKDYAALAIAASALD